MSANWPLVRLGDVLEPVSRPESVDSGREYRLVGAHWYAKGLYVKDTKSGSEIRANALYRVESGDFVYNRLFAWMGSFAVADESTHDCHVSNEFPCFRVNSERLDGRFLWYYFSRQTAWNEALGLSSGGTPTSRNRLREERLLAMAIPLPPLTEQRRIVARVEAILTRVQLAQTLREEANSTRIQLWLSGLETTFESLARYSQPISKILKRVRREVVLEPGTAYLPGGLANQGKGIIEYPPITSADTKYLSLFAIETGELVYSKLKVWEGSIAIAKAEHSGRVFSSEFPIFEIDSVQVQPDYLDLWFRRPSLWSWLGEQVRGIGGRKIRVDEATFLRAPVPLPPIELQRDVATRLHQFSKLTVGVKQLQRDCKSELDALLPSVLAKAFAGEL